MNGPPESATIHASTHESDKDNTSSRVQSGHEVGHSDMIAIEYHHTFAGETTTETKIVPRNSAEARLYLDSDSNTASQPQPTSVHVPVNGKPRRRPLLQKSKFDTGEYANISTSLAKWKIDRKKDQGQKMTTLEKSKLDWAKHVDEQGIREELDVAGKSKGRYLDRMDFLDRSEVLREEERRIQRMKGQ